MFYDDNPFNNAIRHEPDERQRKAKEKGIKKKQPGGGGSKKKQSNQSIGALASGRCDFPFEANEAFILLL
jgi:hypothetical protein